MEKTMPERPKVTREYNSAILDSTYWNHFTPRDDDIVISTSMKAGTTWMQRICAALVFQTAELKEPIDATSPWLDMRSSLPGIVGPALEAQTHRRFIKSHLPLDATPYYDEVKYIVVGRDARDVFMSMVPHHYNIAANALALLNTRDGEEYVAVSRELGIEIGPEEEEIILKQRRQWTGEDIPTLEDVDIREIWRMWTTQSVFPWEQDGYPYWSHFSHLNSWWGFRHLPNILFVHYSDLLEDLDGQMRRVSAWLDIPVDVDIWPSLVDAATFASMKNQHQQTAPAVTHDIWKDPKNFFHKGKNGRWRDVLSEEDLQLYHDLKNRTLDLDAIRWLEDGGLAAGYPDQ
jgi:aryl sulfotransferase